MAWLFKFKNKKNGLGGQIHVLLGEPEDIHPVLDALAMGIDDDHSRLELFLAVCELHQGPVHPLADLVASGVGDVLLKVLLAPCPEAAWEGELGSVFACKGVIKTYKHGSKTILSEYIPFYH